MHHEDLFLWHLLENFTDIVTAGWLLLVWSLALLLAVGVYVTLRNWRFLVIPSGIFPWWLFYVFLYFDLFPSQAMAISYSRAASLVMGLSILTGMYFMLMAARRGRRTVI